MAVARYFFKLMAYKDEYEVARLYTDGAFAQKLKTEFDGNLKLSFHLAPPRRQGAQRYAAHAGPGGTESGHHRRAFRAGQEGGRLRAAGRIYPHLFSKARARVRGRSRS